MQRALTGPDGTQMRVLVVEDNATAAKVFDTMLSKLGCITDTVSDGAEAIAMVDGNRYDCILMCQLPIVDGHAAAKTIREREPEGTHVHIVAVCASSEPEDRQGALEAGMDDYMPKPVHVDELVSILRRGIPEPSSYALVAPIELAVIDDAALFAHIQRFLRDMMEMDDDEEVVGIIDEFLEHGRLRLAELEQATARGDDAAARNEAHAMKGSLSYMGIGELTAMCRTIEKHGTTSAQHDIPALIEQIKAVIARIEFARRANG